MLGADSSDLDLDTVPHVLTFCRQSWALSVTVSLQGCTTHLPLLLPEQTTKLLSKLLLIVCQAGDIQSRSNLILVDIKGHKDTGNITMLWSGCCGMITRRGGMR